MIQKNRIMANKGIIVFDRNIDVEKTQENGKKVCEAYAPLIQQRIRLKMRLPLHTGSLIKLVVILSQVMESKVNISIGL